MRSKDEWTLEHVQRALLQVNQDPGPDYKSGARAFDFRTSGFTFRAHSLKCCRDVLCFSRGEYDFFLRAEFEPMVRSIRDQFLWLNLGESAAIAARHGFHHPQRRGVLRPVNCDFLLSLATGTELAVEVKYSPAFFEEPRKGRRRRRRVELQQAVFAVRDAPLVVVYRAQLNPTVTQNLRALKHHARHLPTSLQARVSDAAEVASRFIQRRSRPRYGELVERLEDSFGLNSARASNLAGTVIWRRMLPVDLRRGLTFEQPIVQTDAPDLHAGLFS